MQKGANSSYFGNLLEGIQSSIKGLRLSFKHLINARKKMPLVNVNDKQYFSEGIGTVTLQYPNEVISVPDTGRYRLFNEMDDCIVCDKCAKVCPVDCIDIEPIKSSELIGNASDGSPIRLYAAKFDIDMAKCCFCGLCTTVCPTECLTMTKAYDFSEFDVKDFNYHYANLSPSQAEEKRKNYEQFLAEKESAKAIKVEENKDILKSDIPKPAFRPSFNKPISKPTESDNPIKEVVGPTTKPKPIFRPGIKPVSENISLENLDKITESSNENKPKPVFRPTIKKPIVEIDLDSKILSDNIDKEIIPTVNEEKPKPKPVFRPTIKKPIVEIDLDSKILSNNIDKEIIPTVNEEKPKPRPIFRPTIKKPKEE